MHDANVMWDGSRQRAYHRTRTERQATAMGGMSVLNNVRTAATSNDMYARCVRDV